MKSDKTTSLVRINVAIGLISAAIIAFQLILMQILSYVQWYHFAYMIISIALLGFGAAGTFLTIFQQKLEKNYYTLFPFLLIVTAILIPVVVGIANSEAVRFDSLLIFQDSRHIGKLILTYFIFFLPFLTGALAIGMSFSKFADQIGKIYFSNLIGSGIGGIIAIFFMQWIIPEQQSFAVAILAFVGGIVSLPKNKKKLIRIIVPLSTLILIILFFYPPRLTPSEYKDISKTMLLPDAKVEYRKSTPHGFVEIVSSPVLRYAPGVSLAYRDSFPVRKVVFNNGNWMGCLLPQPLEANETNILDYTPQALPYHIDNIKNALIINAGTGENVLLALSHQVARITAKRNQSGNLQHTPSIIRRFLSGSALSNHASNFAYARHKQIRFDRTSHCRFIFRQFGVERSRTPIRINHRGSARNVEQAFGERNDLVELLDGLSGQKCLPSFSYH